MPQPYHIHQAPNALTLARHTPARFDVAAEATIAGATDLLRLAHQVRQDVWRAVKVIAVGALLFLCPIAIEADEQPVVFSNGLAAHPEFRPGVVQFSKGSITHAALVSLSMVGQPPTDKNLTVDAAREFCVRAGAQVVANISDRFEKRLDVVFVRLVWKKNEGTNWKAVEFRWQFRLPECDFVSEN